MPDKELTLWLHRPRAGALAYRLDDPARRRTAQGGPEAQVFMHPDDAKKRGQRGMLVKVISRRGEMTARIETKGATSRRSGSSSCRSSTNRGW